MNLHIYTTNMQPATDYVDPHVDPPAKCGFPPNEYLWCHRCRECWPASGMSIQVYYDHAAVWCTEGHGCRDPERMRKHREAERRNRSEAMKESWRRRKEAANAQS